MRSYYRRFLTWAVLNGASALVSVGLALWHHDRVWFVVAEAMLALWFALRAYHYGKAARIARKYIGHPLEYLVLLQLEFRNR